MPFHRYSRAVALAAMAACAPPLLHAQSSGFSGTVALSSQLVDRGIAVTPVTPTLQGAVSWASSSGWSLGLSGSTELRSPGHLAETIAQAAHYWTLSSDWQMQAGVLYYAYPSGGQARYFDRIEAGVGWTYRDVLTFGLSAIDLTRGSDHQPRGAADLNASWPLAWHFSVSAGAGVAQYISGNAEGWYPVYGGDQPVYYHGSDDWVYGYGQLGLLWAYGPWRVQLDRIAVDPAARRRMGSAVAAPWVATLSWSF